MGALVGHDAVHEPEAGQRVVVVEQVADAVGELGVYEVVIAEGFVGALGGRVDLPGQVL